MKPVINLDALEFESHQNGPFQGKYGVISEKIGAKKLGYNLTICPPGKKVGIDMGSEKIGYALVVECEKSNKVVAKGEVEQRKYVNAESKSPVLKTRSSYRRAKRYRRWNRKARFLTV